MWNKILVFKILEINEEVQCSIHEIPLFFNYYKLSLETIKLEYLVSIKVQS